MDAKQAKENVDKSKNLSIARRIKNAIVKLQGNKGVSLVDLKKYLRDEKKFDVEAHNEEIKLELRNAMRRDVLIREGGLYKVKDDKHREDKVLLKKQDGTSMRKTLIEKKQKRDSFKK